jgi:hypothetical protein
LFAAIKGWASADLTLDLAFFVLLLESRSSESIKMNILAANNIRTAIGYAMIAMMVASILARMTFPQTNPEWIEGGVGIAAAVVSLFFNRIAA